MSLALYKFYLNGGRYGDVEAMRDAGTIGYVLKETSSEELVEAIRLFAAERSDSEK
jgi:DNA-binding NarL/FixJ family response regulator